ncbi:tetraspanin-17-like [Petromyzon marinus]|uniref:Tetraspanin-33 n=1 Tax=Petromyzon marinus TaxID=7757 RepID=A0AAJ7TRR9_PETMA|nr:tetraspanin-10-like [Petromyzon marinus]XP_032822851.1 tetraspanin-10-like [Petromyzon marinus]XP_032822852.1 tetraspanin-10-like [Petromyzon marinus]
MRLPWRSFFLPPSSLDTEERQPLLSPTAQVSAPPREAKGRPEGSAEDVTEVGEVEEDRPAGEVAPASLAARWVTARVRLRAWLALGRSKAQEHRHHRRHQQQQGRSQRRHSLPQHRYHRHHQRHHRRGGPRVNLCAKYSLFCSQFLVAALSCLTLAVSLWGLADKERFSSSSGGADGGAALLPADPLLIPLLAGAGSAALAALGCAGSLRERPPLLRAFAAGLGALVCAEAVGALAAYGAREWVGEALARGVARGVERYRDDPDVRFIVDELQRGLRCCGAASYRDWERNVYFNCSSPGVQACGVPASCCLPQIDGEAALPDPVVNSQCGYGALRVSEAEALARVHAAGCAARFSAWFHTNAGGLGAAAIALLSAQVAALGLATKMLSDIEMVKARW